MNNPEDMIKTLFDNINTKQESLSVNVPKKASCSTDMSEVINDTIYGLLYQDSMTELQLELLQILLQHMQGR